MLFQKDFGGLALGFNVGIGYLFTTKGCMKCGILSTGYEN